MLSSIGAWILFFAIPLTEAARKWEYEPISINVTTSDPSKLYIEAKIDRLGRGDFALSGIIDWKYDATEETRVEAYSYRSSSGAESDYKLLPWTIPKQPLYDYLNTYYKDMVMKNLGYCSNLPRFEGKFTPPFPHGTYKLDKCKFDGEGMPEILPPGFYKVIVTKSGPGQPTWGFTAVFRLTNKLY